MYCTCTIQGADVLTDNSFIRNMKFFYVLFKSWTGSAVFRGQELMINNNVLLKGETYNLYQPALQELFARNS